MVFRKTGEAPIEAVYCSCGAKLAPGQAKCANCSVPEKPDNEPKRTADKQESTDS
jgi:hypothetical protein